MFENKIIWNQDFREIWTGADSALRPGGENRDLEVHAVCQAGRDVPDVPVVPIDVPVVPDDSWRTRTGQSLSLYVFLVKKEHPLARLLLRRKATRRLHRESGI